MRKPTRITLRTADASWRRGCTRSSRQTSRRDGCSAELDDLTLRGAFVVAMRGRSLWAAPISCLSSHVAEVRSLAVDRNCPGSGVEPCSSRNCASARGKASTRSARSRTGPAISAGWGSRSSRTSGCREDLHRLREVSAVPPVRQTMLLPLDAFSSEGSTVTRPKPSATAMTASTLIPGTISGGITTPQDSGRPVSAQASRRTDSIAPRLRPPGDAAAVFTTNRRRRRRGSRAITCSAPAVSRAIVVNSGCANACTGDAACGSRAKWPPKRAADRVSRRTSWSRRQVSSASPSTSTRFGAPFRRDRPRWRSGRAGGPGPS